MLPVLEPDSGVFELNSSSIPVFYRINLYLVRVNYRTTSNHIILRIMNVKILKTAVVCVLLSCFCSFSPKEEWTSLLDKDLTQWEMYMSFEHKPGYHGEKPLDEAGNPIQPIGYNKNVKNVFSVIEQDGIPVLRISGEIYGCVYTKQAFENYHLKMKVKFGTKKWNPRLNEPMDSGLLYHSHGECGVDYWRSWMQSHEFQVMEGGFGDYWRIANTGATIKMHDPEANNEKANFDPNGIATYMGADGTRGGFVQFSEDREKVGEWNTLELICFGDKSIHIVNGHVVMALSGSVYKDGKDLKPLTKGKIQLQSEAAEVFYKEIQIKNIKELPSEYKQFIQ